MNLIDLVKLDGTSGTSGTSGVSGGSSGTSGNPELVYTNSGVVDIPSITDNENNSVTIGRNGLKIMGADSDYTLSTENQHVKLVYYNATYGWRVF